MSANDVKITKIGEEAHIGPTGVLRREVVITFTVGDHGPFSERFDRVGFNPVAARQAVNEFANKLSQLPGVQ